MVIPSSDERILNPRHSRVILNFKKEKGFFHFCITIFSEIWNSSFGIVPRPWGWINKKSSSIPGNGYKHFYKASRPGPGPTQASIKSVLEGGRGGLFLAEVKQPGRVANL
jgi:hypothetical protein